MEEEIQEYLENTYRNINFEVSYKSLNLYNIYGRIQISIKQSLAFSFDYKINKNSIFEANMLNICKNVEKFIIGGFKK